MKQNTKIRLIPKFTQKGLIVTLVTAFLLIGISLIDVYLISVGRYLPSLKWLMTVVLVIFGLALVVEFAGLFIQKRSSYLKALKIVRHLDSNLPKDETTTVTLRLITDGTSQIKAYLMDSFDAATSSALPIFVDFGEIQQGTDRVIVYDLTPNQRGYLTFFEVDLQLLGRFGLFELYHRVATQGVNQAKVFANFKENLNGNLLAIAQKQAINGLLHQKRRGQGQDFHQIRSYDESDSIRHIDWKATSRLARLMTKEFSDENDQQILFLVDSSSHMRHFRYETDRQNTHKKSHIDSVLDSMLLLANVALKQGDAVGFISFSGNHDKVVAPKKSLGILNTFVAQSFDIEPSLKVPDYMHAAKIAMSLQKKRGLIILLTSTRTENFDELMRAVNLMKSRHLVIVANLYEDDLSNFMSDVPATHETAKDYHVVYEHLVTQSKLNAHLTSLANTYAIHCNAKKLPIRLVNQYLSIKSKSGF